MTQVIQEWIDRAEEDWQVAHLLSQSESLKLIGCSHWEMVTILEQWDIRAIVCQ